IRHLDYAGNKWCKGADNGHKAGINNGLESIFVIKALCFFEIRLLEYPGFLRKDPLSKMFSYFIVDKIADNGRRNQQDQHEPKAKVGFRFCNQGTHGE